MSDKTKSWIKAASIRMIKTMAQSALGTITIGMTLNEIGWAHVLSAAVVAGAVSILTSIDGLPEVTTTETIETEAE